MIKGFVGRVARILRRMKFMTMILWVTFFTSSIVLVVVDDGDSMLATSAFLILHDHSATAAAIADADVSVFLGLRRYLSSFFLPVS